MSWYRIFLLGLIVFSVNLLQGQTSFNTRVSAKHIGKQDVVEVSFEMVNGQPESFAHPSFAEWRLVGGPNQSSSTIVSNGQTTTSISYSFILEPVKAGVFIIAGAKAVINGKNMTSNPVQIKVDEKDHIGGGGNVGNNSGSILDPFLEPVQEPADQYDGYLLKPGEDAVKKTKENLFLMVSVNKKSCFLGEVVVAEYSLYTRVNMQANITKRPSFNGFSSIDLADSSLKEFTTLTYKGKEYRVYRVRKVQLYALQTGKQTLSPVEIEAKVEYRKIPSTANLNQYDPYSPDNVMVLPYTVVSEPITIDVLPLPAANQPASFTGATGRFDIKTKLTKNELALKQAGTLEVEISGQGNWAMVQQPNIKWPAGFDVFEPTSIENIDSQAIPLAGKRIYTYQFTASDSGQFTIPAIDFAYFDPWKKSFQTSKSDSLQVTVLNKTLSIGESSYEAPERDSTEIFSDIVKIVFPVLAIGLLAWIWLSGRQRKKAKQARQFWDHYHRPGMEPDAPEDFKPIVTATPPNNPTAPEDYVKYKPGFERVTKEEPIALSPEVVSELPELKPANPFVFETAGSFFSSVRKELENLLKNHWQIESASAGSLTGQLVSKGMLADDAESVQLLWDACNRHLYSPLANSEDLQNWNSIFEEIKTVLEKK